MRNGTERRWSLVLCAVTWLALGCGDDDVEQPLDGGGGSGGSGGNASDGGRRPLGDDVAGKACGSPAECGGATCAMQIAGTAIGAAPLPAPGGYCTAACTTDADCGMGGACIGALGDAIAGQCFATCSAPSDCREGYLCGGGFSLGGISVPNTCRPSPETDQLDDDVAGAACSSDDDCSGGSCLTMRQTLLGSVALPGGYCSGRCLEDDHCGEGGVCLPALLGGAGSCYESCETDADCARDGYRCRPLSSGIRGCNPAADPLPDDTAGGACSSDDDCGGGADTCATSLPASGIGGVLGGRVDAPGGYCSQSCVEDIDCGGGGVCIGGALGAGACFARCTDDADCRDGYRCEDRSAGGGAPATDAGAGAAEPALVCAPVPPTNDDDAGM